MAFGKRHDAGAARAARLAAKSSVATAGAPLRATISYDDPEAIRNRMKPFGVEETPDERRMRLRAKTVNFSATFLARAVIMAAAGYFMLQEFRKWGYIDRRIGFGLVAMGADFTRVLGKCMTPGTK